MEDVAIGVPKVVFWKAVGETGRGGAEDRGGMNGWGLLGGRGGSH